MEKELGRNIEIGESKNDAIKDNNAFESKIAHKRIGEALESDTPYRKDIQEERKDELSQNKEISEIKDNIESTEELHDSMRKTLEDDTYWDRTSLRHSEEDIIKEMIENEELDITQYDKNSVEPIKSKQHIPETTGDFEGEKGNSRFSPHNTEAIEKMKEYGQDFVEYREGNPDFSPFTEHKSKWGDLDCQVEIAHMTDQRTNAKWEFGRRKDGHDHSTDLGNFAQADNVLLERIRKIDPNATASDVVEFRNNRNLTWHECSDGKTMQLVPTEIHDACKHSGGVSEMKYRMAMGNIESIED